MFYKGQTEKEEGEPDCYIIEDEYPKKINRSWARLIMKICEVDPLTCPRFGGDMRIIAFIEDYKIVKKILDYLGIYEFGRKRPPLVVMIITASNFLFLIHQALDFCIYSFFILR